MDIIFLNYDTFTKIIDELNKRGNIIFLKNQENFMILNLASILYLIFLTIILINILKFVGKLIK